MLLLSRLKEMVMTKCAILGASGHGKVIADIAELNGFKEIHFFDDRWPLLNKIEHWQISGDTQVLLSQVSSFDLTIVAIGNNSIRLTKHHQLLAAGAFSPPLVHPQAVVSRYAQLGQGCVVMAGAIINPFCRIGEACIINTSASIDHDCQLEDGVHISPGAHLAGAVRVGKRSWIGIGAQVKQLLSIGIDSIVGAGATVVNNVLDHQVVVGTPAKNH